MGGSGGCGGNLNTGDAVNRDCGSAAGTVNVTNYMAIGTAGDSSVGIAAQSIGGGGGAGGFKLSAAVSSDANGFGASSSFGFGSGGGAGAGGNVSGHQQVG